MKNIYSILIILFFFTFSDCSSRVNKENITEFTIEFDYWEGCETGQGDCQPLNFERKSKQDSIILIMPCGGTFTTVHLTREGQFELIKKLSIEHDECPPTFDLTGLEDGTYEAYMWACGLGGPIKFNLLRWKL